ncbi:hypothetical protein ACJJTC_014478 [Scirpophaga incertulas]
MHSLNLLWTAHNENAWEKRQKRLDKSSFTQLCDDLKVHTELKGSLEITLEVKVLCILSFLATGSYERIVGVGQYLTQRTTSRCIREEHHKKEPKSKNNFKGNTICQE